MSIGWKAATLTVLTGSLLVTGGGSPAQAAPPMPAAAPQDAGIDNSITLTDAWPKELRKFVPGTKEFQAAYRDSGPIDPRVVGDACAQPGRGGDVEGYVDDFMQNFGTIMDAASTAVGTPVLRLSAVGDDVQIPSTPWKWPNSQDDSLEDVLRGTGARDPHLGAEAVTADDGSPGAAMAAGDATPGLPGSPFKWDDVTKADDGQWKDPCAEDFARFGKQLQDEEKRDSPFGFGFYGEPDAESQAWFMTTIAAAKPLPRWTDSQNRPLLPPRRYWESTANEVRGWDYSPLNIGHYCDDRGSDGAGSSGNPLCLTATFLHCPKAPQVGRYSEAEVHNCRVWNAKTILRQQAFVSYLRTPGVGYDANGHLKFDAVNLMQAPGSIAPLDLLTALMIKGKGFEKFMKTFDVGFRIIAAVTAVIIAGATIYLGRGFLLSGGLRSVLRLGKVAAVGAAAAAAWATVWGVVNCGAELDKCLAQLSAKAMAGSAELVANSATSVPYPNVSGPTSNLFNRLAGISGVLMMLFLLIALIVALVTGRHGLLIETSVGAIRWAVSIGLGATLITTAFLICDTIANAIAGGGPGEASDSLGNVAETAMLMAMRIGSRAGFLQWLIVGVVCLLGFIGALAVYVITLLTSQFIPFVVAVLILQMAGQAGPKRVRQWASVGWSLLWSIMLLRPIIALIGKMAGVNALENGLTGLITISAMFLIAGFAPALVVKWFPMLGETGMGILRSLGNAAMGANQAKQLAGAAGMSRGGALGRLLGGGSGGPGGPSVSPKSTPPPPGPSTGSGKQGAAAAADGPAARDGGRSGANATWSPRDSNLPGGNAEASKRSDTGGAVGAANGTAAGQQAGGAPESDWPPPAPGDAVPLPAPPGAEQAAPEPAQGSPAAGGQAAAGPSSPAGPPARQPKPGIGTTGPAPKGTSTSAPSAPSTPPDGRPGTTQGGAGQTPPAPSSGPGGTERAGGATSASPAAPSSATGSSPADTPAASTAGPPAADDGGPVGAVLPLPATPGGQAGPGDRGGASVSGPPRPEAPADERRGAGRKPRTRPPAAAGPGEGLTRSDGGPQRGGSQETQPGYTPPARHARRDEGRDQR